MIERYLHKTSSASPLAVFRIGFGLLLFVSTIRFWANGWIEALYLEPELFFPYYGFEFIQAPGLWIYGLFVACALSALFVALGFYYRVASVTLFLSFTYIELIDKSTYLNHYYFVSMIALLMIFLPAHVMASLDARRKPEIASTYIPAWTTDSIKLFVCLLYFFAGLAKINSDWLLEAQPLRIWLPAKNDLPIIGSLFNYTWVAYVFSWAGCLYDLSIPFLLLNNRTRTFGYCAVIIFHVITSMLFPIGMFPYIMIATAIIFFPHSLHDKILNILPGATQGLNRVHQYSTFVTRLMIGLVMIFFTIQVALPFRHLLYPGELFWTEEGYRFSWRVMLMEKAGHAQFTVRDESGKVAIVDNREFLTPLQEKMMATQPDMILQFAHYLRDHYKVAGYHNPEVYVDSYVTLNGRLGKPLIDPSVNLADQQDSFSHKEWILKFSDEIGGL